MDIAELLDAAKRKKKTLGAVADGLGVHQNRLSEWRKGTYKPDATTIAQLAEMAELPIFETVAQVEASLDHSKAAAVWERALGKLRAAGVAATVILTLGTSLATSHDARAAGVQGSESTLSARISENGPSGPFFVGASQGVSPRTNGTYDACSY
jgi:transcriptional regulator with XRE-family HTH domain